MSSVALAKEDTGKVFLFTNLASLTRMRDSRSRGARISPRKRRMDSGSSVRDAPTTLSGALKEIGPGLIVAGSIVGSGELIATTLTGAEAGFWLLWLILIGCTVKVFAQLELGRFTLTTGHTTLAGLSRLPGAAPAGLHWVVWLWLASFVFTVGQAGGIVGAVGQSITMSVPLTASGEAFDNAANERVKAQIARVQEGAAGEDDQDNNGGSPPVESLHSGLDVYYWAFLITVITAALLYFGRYNLIEKTVMALVAGFTFHLI